MSIIYHSMCSDCGLTKETTSGHKVVKKQITYSMCGNTDGSDILQPFVIGKPAKPQAFKGKTGAQLSFHYHNNGKAWMTSILFEEWLEKWNGIPLNSVIICGRNVDNIVTLYCLRRPSGRSADYM